jgi:hypothetical protein
MKMENNIDPAVIVKPASGVARNPQDSTTTRIYKRDGAQNLGDVRAEIGKKRLDAAKKSRNDPRQTQRDFTIFKSGNEDPV